MDRTNLIICGAIALTVLLTTVVIAVRYRRSAKVKVQWLGGGSLELEGSNAQASPLAGVRLKGAKSRQGGLTAIDETGRGADVQDVEVEKDINVRSTGAASGHDPKA